MSVPSAVGHSEPRYSTLLQFFLFLPGVWMYEHKRANRTEKKPSSSTTFLLLSLFLSPFIYIFFLFFIPWNTVGFGFFGFSLSIWFLLIISFVLALLLFVWWDGPGSGFSMLRPIGNVAVWKNTVVFQWFFHTCAGHFPRASFLLLYLIKMIRLPHTHGEDLMARWFQRSMKSHKPLVGFRESVGFKCRWVDDVVKNVTEA